MAWEFPLLMKRGASRSEFQRELDRALAYSKRRGDVPEAARVTSITETDRADGVLFVARAE